MNRCDDEALRRPAVSELERHRGARHRSQLSVLLSGSRRVGPRKPRRVASAESATEELWSYSATRPPSTAGAHCSMTAYRVARGPWGLAALLALVLTLLLSSACPRCARSSCPGRGQARYAERRGGGRRGASLSLASRISIRASRVRGSLSPPSLCRGCAQVAWTRPQPSPSASCLMRRNDAQSPRRRTVPTTATQLVCQTVQ